MWPERLYQVAQAIRSTVDESELSTFFDLASLSQPEAFEYEDEYRAQVLAVHQTLLVCASALHKLSVDLSAPLEAGLKDSVNGAVRELTRTRGLFSYARNGENPITGLGDPNEFGILVAFNFALIAVMSDLCTTASKLSMSVEEADTEKASYYLVDVEKKTSDIGELWSARPRDGFDEDSVTQSLSGVGLYDFKVGVRLNDLRFMRGVDKPLYLRELSKIVHVAMEDVRGSRDFVPLNEFYDRLSCVSLFLSIGFNDVMFCFAELLERGWVGRIQDVGGRQVLEITRPQLDELYADFERALRGEAITTDSVMRDLDLDFFTAFHLIKDLERSGVLMPDEFNSEPAWRWGSRGGMSL